MPDVHVPKLDDHDDGGAHAAPMSTHRSPRKSIVTIALEIALIGTGVFLGLAGEQWREYARHREMADAALRRFRAEAVANRSAVAAVKDYHIDRLKALNAYLAAVRKNRPAPEFGLHGLQPAFFEHTAWDLALATQSLAYIDSDLAFAISRVYNAQDTLVELTRGVTQAMYVNPPGVSQRSFLEAVAIYYGDATLSEPQLLKMYDELVPRIDRALGETAADAPGSK
jgi:hypothetical protein